MLLRHMSGRHSSSSRSIWLGVVQQLDVAGHKDAVRTCIDAAYRAPHAQLRSLVRIAAAEQPLPDKESSSDGGKSIVASHLKWHTRLQSAIERPDAAVVSETSEAVAVQRRLLQAGILGAPNAGKSSLANALAGRKVAAVSPRTNTTSASRLAAFTDGAGTQVALYDTPGVLSHYQSQQQGAKVQGAWQVAGACDTVLFLVDAARQLERTDPRVVRLVEQLAGRWQASKAAAAAAAADRAASTVGLAGGGTAAAAGGGAPSAATLPAAFKAALVLNKVDRVQQKKRLVDLATTLSIQSGGAFEEIFMTSALLGDGIPELREYLLSQARPSQWLMEDPGGGDPVDAAADLAVELVREQLFQRISAELPYILHPVTTEARRLPSGSMLLKQTIFVDHIGVRGILLGQHGAVIGKIGIAARQKAEEQLGHKVHLYISVMVRKPHSSETSQLMTQQEA